MLLRVLFLLTIFMPNVGVPWLLPTDNQPISPFLAALLILCTSSLRIPRVIKYISIVFLFFAFLSLFSSFCGFTPQVTRHFITYILIILILLASSSINFSLADLSAFFKWFCGIIAFGFFLNVISPSLLSLFVLRSTTGVIRALSSFYSEPAFLCQTIFLLTLFLFFFSSIRPIFLAIAGTALILPAAAGQIFLSFMLLGPSYLLILFNSLSLRIPLPTHVSVKSLIIYIIALFSFVYSLVLLLKTSILNHFFQVFTQLFLSGNALIQNDSASYKISGFYFSFTFPLLYPFDYCVQKASFIKYYPDVLDSWKSFSDMFFTKIGYGSYLYSTYGNILVDLGLLGLLFTAALFLLLWKRIFNFKHVSVYLCLSCFWFLFIALFSIAGFGYWPAWFILGYTFNRNCQFLPIRN